LAYYLGIDGGGSKTLAVVADAEGRIVGRGRSGCGNHQLDAALAERNIAEAAADAMREAGLGLADIRFATFGLAGADREADYRVLRPMIARLGFERHAIVCDTVIGLRAGTRQPDGVVLVCGSGTNCYGINGRGEEFQVGGFGYAFGDFGGGSELAVEVFRSVIRSWEGRESATLLTDATIRELGYGSVDAMFHGFLDEGREIPHRLAKLLFEVAEKDRVARVILERQGAELGKAAGAVIRKLGMEDARFDLVLIGSILTRGDNRYVVPSIEREIRTIAERCTLRTLETEPVAGAILLALERSGAVVSDRVYDNLNRSLAVREEKPA